MATAWPSSTSSSNESAFVFVTVSCLVSVELLQAVIAVTARIKKIAQRNFILLMLMFRFFAFLHDLMKDIMQRRKFGFQRLISCFCLHHFINLLCTSHQFF